MHHSTKRAYTTVWLIGVAVGAVLNSLSSPPDGNRHKAPSNASESKKDQPREQAQQPPKVAAQQSRDRILEHPASLYGVPSLKEQVLVREGFIIAWDNR
jgi:hypothetical protein